jgi:hypothetical protein
MGACAAPHPPAGEFCFLQPRVLRTKVPKKFSQFYPPTSAPPHNPFAISKEAAMERNAETEWEVLKRIVAMLFALAELADRASLVPYSVRGHVLAILRPAEAVMQAFVINMARDSGVLLPPQTYLALGMAICAPDDDNDGDDPGSDPNDASRLAFRLRVLALVLASLLTQSECLSAECLAFCNSGRIAAGAQIDARLELLQKLGQLAAYGRQQRAPPPGTCRARPIPDRDAFPYGEHSG